MLGFGITNRFEKNPLNLSCGGSGTTIPWDRQENSGYHANLTVLEQSLVDLKEKKWYLLETTGSGISVTQRRANCNECHPTPKSEGAASLGRGLWGRLGRFLLAHYLH